LPTISLPQKDRFDRTNAVLAAVVYVIAFIFYALTVQRTFSFWDCGEFVACSYILGIPHPPGTPLFVMIGRLFSLIPFVTDIAYRINYISVITSAFTAMFSYLLTVRLVGYFFGDKKHESINRFITYIGGIAGGLFVAFSRTNWSNSIEAEVYGAALALSTMIIWLALIYYENRGTSRASRILVLVFYLASLGIGVHMTVFLVVPIASLFFILNKDATVRDYTYLSLFVVAELLLIMLTAMGGGTSAVFYVITAGLGLALITLIYSKINWAHLIAIGCVSSVMISFSLYMKMVPVVLVIMLILAFLAQKNGWRFQWKTGVAIIIIGVLGMSVHAYIPIRSTQNPRIDENNPDRDWYTFIKFLDRKQYGQESMIDRMFHRRGEWSNQFGRHANMGFWSYFEDQYSRPGWNFVPFLLLGLIGLYVAIRKRLEIGLPFMVLILVCSVGLILYMNFADGTQYSARTGDAYLEVRNRDYFFTPAFVFFGIAIGMGIAAVMAFLRETLAKSSSSLQKTAVYASSVLVLTPAFALGHNYHANDRSKNYIPYNYAANLLDTCAPNSILFTSGDNDTFPLWCIQEVYNYRKDVRIVNLSLLNTDWYVYQMKHQYGIPISLTDKQILWKPIEVQPGVTIERPEEPFYDRPRQRQTYMVSIPYNGRMVRVADMMMDEIVLQNQWKDPIYFSSPPYAESPLKLTDRSTTVGIAYRLDREPPPRLIDADTGYDLFMNTYRFAGYENSDVYRDDNATGVYLGYGVNAVRLWDEFSRTGDTTRQYAIADHIMKVYPEYWQMWLLRAAEFDKVGDSTAGDSLMFALRDTLSSFLSTNPESVFYTQDLGLVTTEIGNREQSDTLKQEGIDLLWKGFMMDPNSGHAFRKLFTVLSNQRRYSDIQRALAIHTQYKRNLQDAFVQQLMGQMSPQPPPTPQQYPSP